MTHRLHWIFIGGLFAGCTSAPDPVGTLPDHFDENLDVITRSVSHPCGADADTDGDGMIDVHYTYTYDAQGRSRQDVGKDLTGAVYDQIDYTWDNAGHLIEQVDDFVFVHLKQDAISTFDTLGRRVEFRDDEWNDTTAQFSDVITYADFDDHGHAAHAAQTIQNLVKNTSTMQTRSYGYDELGRRITLDVRDATGGLVQGWQYVYDDTARTVTTTLTEPTDAQGNQGFNAVYLDTYDADYHWLSTHEVDPNPDGTVSETVDTQNQWSGDRELSSMTTWTGIVMQNSAITYKYQCNASQAAGRQVTR